MLRGWDDAPAVILSCPGPLRRHHAAIQPIAHLSLPQCLLGGEAQLQAFAASAKDLTPRLFFAPMPEMFSTPQSAQALLVATGGAPDFTDDEPAGNEPAGGEQAGTEQAGTEQAGTEQAGRMVHLRFGGTRSARIMKGARNGLVLAENHAAPPITASQHPFASGLTLPAHMRRLFTYDRDVPRPVALGGATIPATPLPRDSITADLNAAPLDTPAETASARAPAGAPDGLELVSLAEFRSPAWAAGPVRGRSPHLREARSASRADGAPFVLLPWNLDHPGSAVPALLERALRLQPPGAPAVRIVLMPFNYPGQTGLIRRLIRLAREAGTAGDRVLSQIFIGRLTHLSAVQDLRALAKVVWVDGNDPEAAWTARRLHACGIAPIVIGSAAGFMPDEVATVAADDTLTITADTRFGQLHFRAQLPSLRGLRDLLPLTRALAGPQRPRRAARAGAAP